EKEEEEKADENSASESSSSSSEEDSSEASDSSSEEEEEKSMEVDETENKNNKRKADTSDDDNENPAKAAKTEEKFTVWCGGLNWEATVEQIKEHFAQCGEIVDVRLRMDNATGKNKGFCHVDFATKEGQEAALALSNTEFLGRTIRLDSADGNNRQRTKKDENYGPRTNKVFCANLNRDFDEESHRNSLNEHFGKFGKIVDIRIPYDRESGAMKGIAYIEFENPDQAEAAVTGMNGVEVNGRPLRTDYSGSNDRDRVNQRGGRGGPRGGRGGFRGGRGGGRGGFRGGRGGFR
ncbi:hypothetical protein BDF20DRAFT_803135, partial [Mycotypha africana]|uniref:uncharacterized protein n=1 Tax=Mycotypha africana TaxID=64632 RepID=UPI002300CB04